MTGDAPRELRTAEELAAAIGKGVFLLVKHSRVCPISRRAFERYEEFAGRHPEVSTGWLDVIASRPLARGLADETGVRHESPQALLFRDGEVVWHASHSAITAAALEEACGV